MMVSRGKYDFTRLMVFIRLIELELFADLQPLNTLLIPNFTFAIFKVMQGFSYPFKG